MQENLKMRPASRPFPRCLMRERARRRSSILSRVFVALLAATIAAAGYTAFADWEGVTQPILQEEMPSGD